MVQRLIPALGSGNSYIQIVLNPSLPDEVIKTPWSQAGIKWYVLSTGFTRYNASYFNLTPFRFFSNPIPFPQLGVYVSGYLWGSIITLMEF